MSGSQIQAFAGTFENGGSSQWRHELLDCKQIKPYRQPLYTVGVTAFTSHSILYLSYRVSFTLPNIACFAIRIRCVFALTFTFLNNFVLSSLIFENFREVANKLINCCKRAQYWVYSTTLTQTRSTRFLFQYKIHVYRIFMDVILHLRLCAFWKAPRSRLQKQPLISKYKIRIHLFQTLNAKQIYIHTQ